MPKIAVFGGTGYLASLIKNQNKIKNNSFTFFSRKKFSRNYINFSLTKKNSRTLKNYDFLIHLVGPNQSQLKNNKKLIDKKNLITSRICDLCLNNNIKLLYISSMQIYKNYGKNDITVNSKINLQNVYSKSHHDTEQIILKKFLNNKKMFTILRMGNVFGLRKINNLRDINSNLIHSFCNTALKKKNILIRDGSIQRTFIPSQIFVQIINLIIDKNLFYNSIENISYKNFNLKEIANIIKKRLKLLLKQDVSIKINKFNSRKLYKISSSRYFKLKIYNKKIYFEIDQLLKYIKKNN